MDARLKQQKEYPRAMRPYVLTLYEMVREIKPERVLEIGVQNGQSTKTILMALGMNKNGRLVSIDHKRRHGVLDQDYSDLKQYWTFILGSSHLPETLQAARHAIKDDQQYDMLFIDGDHKMPGIQQDWDNYEPLVKPGGLILMHDIYNKNEDVSQVWEKIKYKKLGFNWGWVRTTVLPGFGIVKKPPYENLQR